MYMYCCKLNFIIFVYYTIYSINYIIDQIENNSKEEFR